MNKLLYFFFLCLLAASFHSCIDEGISSDTNLQLTFSVDTIAFDTVFATTTTATAKLKVYNRSKENIRLSSVWVGGKSNSPFRINVQGKASDYFSNVELRAKDSLYVLVNVTVKPNDTNAPVVIADSIGFLTNGNTQFVQLRAIGQDVEVFRDKTISADSVLTGEKPFLVYGNLTVNENVTLTIAKGTKLYFHANAGVEVYGNLNIEGTLQEPVLMRGDRMDYLFEGVPYDTLSGQWNGIRLLNENARHTIDYLEIRSGKTAIQITGQTVQPKLVISNSSLHNFDSCAIFARNAEVEINNTQLSNCAVHNLLAIGGKVSVIQSTIANYYPLTKRKGASISLQNKDNEVILPIQAKFTNTIVIGNRDDEVALSETEATGEFNVLFFNCFKEGEEEENPFYQSTVWADAKTKKIFRNWETYPYNFRLAENALPIGLANADAANQYPTDKDGNSRFADGAPDIGAYEFVPY